MEQSHVENKNIKILTSEMGFPGGSDGKDAACDAGNPGSIPGSGKSPGQANGNPLQYSCLENPMDRGAWRATVHRVEKNQTRLKQLGMHAEKEVAPATEGKQPRLEPKS